MNTLADLAKLIRSKNAGPFVLTFDVMFDSEQVYTRVKRSGVLNVGSIATMYGCLASDVRFFECDNALAFKFSIPRPATQGTFGDPDLHGGQQHVPLMELVVPDVLDATGAVTI
jgi:hypothetical protein